LEQFKLISIMLTGLTRIAGIASERPAIAVTPQRPQILCFRGPNVRHSSQRGLFEHLFVSDPCFMLRATSPIQE
jgi:hypothetical protein